MTTIPAAPPPPEGPAPPRWVMWAAHAVPLCALGLWRFAAAGFPFGRVGEALRTDVRAPEWGIAFAVGAGLVAGGAALVTLSRVRPRGGRRGRISGSRHDGRRPPRRGAARTSSRIRERRSRDV
ncbi:hypothetical protein [Yinghuangia soli]|uniref:Uncharacterized protein n=1 Tax=Yinghuangia soli TaxID=2908204 RepID=A0AA41U3V6_9ACTN|nr:hypothetical protein [Yinghuangia soli]MCF2533128.1 hypothetical protein [Yinghuangia soli]